MVVGIDQYEDKNEAYPLDKKTLHKVALRSLFLEAGSNAECGESIGWCWALTPALNKIHTNEHDLSLSKGHNLEYVKTGSFFSTLSMGIVLALESKKADLETIRSIRTTVNGLCDALSTCVFEVLFMGILGYTCASLTSDGDITPVICFSLISLLCMFILRFVLLTFGYKHATEILDKIDMNQEAFKKASMITGVFCIVGLCMSATRYITIGDSYISLDPTISFPSTIALVTLPGIFGLVATYAFYQLLTKKNYTILQCVLMVVLIGMLVTIAGIGLSLVF